MPSRHDSAADFSPEVHRFDAHEWPSAMFQIGDGHLVLTSFDKSLVDRFRSLYGDCEVDAGSARGPRVTCDVKPPLPGHHDAGDEITVDLREPVPGDLAAFIETVFSDRGARRLPPIGAEWQAMECRNPDVSFRVRGHEIRFPAAGHWRSLVGNLALALTFRQQPDIIYLHASGVAFGGGLHGVLFAGPKEAGKTTTALGLASRGHRFLGDEVVGVRSSTGEVVPILRSISKREGPCAEGVNEAMAALSPARGRYPDGLRTVVPASRLFTTSAAPVQARAIVFLGGYGAEPVMSRLPASLETASKLTPVASTLWGLSAGARAFALLKLITSVPSYLLRVGPPDDTARFLEAAFDN